MPLASCWLALDEFFDALVDDLMKLLHGLGAALRDHDGLAGRQIHQLEQGLEAGDIPVFGPFQMLEVLEVGNRRGREAGETGGVELRAGDGENSRRRYETSAANVTLTQRGSRRIFVRQHEFDARLNAW